MISPRKDGNLFDKGRIYTSILRVKCMYIGIYLIEI